MPETCNIQSAAEHGSRGNRGFYAALYAVILLWGILIWALTAPESLVSDWNGWRQADTQAIALNFYHQGLNVFYPQIDWGGAGPGYVEAEFQLYPALMCLGFRLFGIGVWQGQLLSLLSLMGAAFYIALLCRRYFSGVASVFGTMLFLSCLGTLHLATAVQPDAFCFFFYAASMYYFSGYVVDTSRRDLTAAFICSTLAVLVKPPALHLGIIQFLWVAIAAPGRLRSRALWLHWFGILGLLGIYYYHAHQIYITYGNTFGIGTGGDSKFPAMADLINPRHYYRIVRASLTWGLTAGGLIAGVGLLLMRRLKAFEIAAALGVGAMLVLAMRYTSYVWFGSHYHIFAGLLGAFLCAHVLDVLMPRKKRPALAVCIILFSWLSLSTGQNAVRRLQHGGLGQGLQFEAFGREIAGFVKAGDLIIIRADAPARVEGWQGSINNFEDPRLFYLTSTKGWVIAQDADDPGFLVDCIEEGARFYVHPAMPMSPRIGHWLENHAILLSETENGLVYQLNQGS